MTLDCQEIHLALKFSIDAGNSLHETSEGWANAKKVFHI
jgi:hypothetical protein